VPFAVNERHLLVPHGERGPVAVRFDGSYVWSFAAARDGSWRPRGWKVPWPEALRRRLEGTTVVALASAEEVRFEAPITFGGVNDPLRLVDGRGHRLAVDSAGHLTRVFSETDQDMRDQIVEATRTALADLRAEGFDAHLSYGCLLGAVRDGRMIGHDSDADLAYLSKYTLPAQVIGESYAMERALARRGWAMVRMSNADLKLLYPLPDGRKVHIDVFGAFHVGGTFYQLGGRSGVLPRSALTPAGTVMLEGVELPAPPDPEAVLAFLYGPSWRTPDPAFQNSDPPGGLRRIQGWMRGFRDDVISWNEFFRDHHGDVPWKQSEFAGWVEERLGADEPIADIGCGTGRDAAWFTRRGRPVLAYDVSGAALRRTRRRMARNGAEGTQARTLSLNDRRSVLVAGAELARTDQPVNLYARHLVNCLDEESLDHLFLLSSMALRRGGSLFLEFSAGRRGALAPEHLMSRVDPAKIVAGIEARGGVIDDLQVGPSSGFLGEADPRVARLVAHWPHPCAPRTPTTTEATR
jgi:hypothetical protein